MQAKKVTDDEFKEAKRAVTETLSKKRGVSPAGDTEAESGEGRRQQSKRKKTVRFVEAEGSGTQMCESMKAAYLF